MEKETKKNIESVGMAAGLGFSQGVMFISFLLGLYNLFGLDSVFPALKSFAEPLGPWWFAVSLGGLLLYIFNKAASKLPSIYD